ncbi:MAG: GatB/YqeY domain-containing protein [Spirochaetes bacterium]|nr:GatB/YqeY domain-containing protein [Spirochaetota bacterium]
MKNWKKELNDIVTKALKEKDTVTVNVIKMLKTDLTNEEIKNNREELKEEQVISVIQHAAKQRKESIEEYKKVNKPERAKEEEEELKILEKFLPDQLDAKKLEKIIDETLKEVKAEDMKDFGKAMGAVMQKVKGQADGKMVQDLVKKLLS